jgi:MFS transporter, PAT family, beta-lactamase induction signal transducer AmpG
VPRSFRRIRIKSLAITWGAGHDRLCLEAIHTNPVSEARFSLHPVIFTILYVPFGAVSGFIGVALAFLATRRGLSVQQGAELVAIFLVPQIWKFFLAPVADATLSRHTWYLLSAVVSAAGLFAMAAVPLGPGTFRLIQGIILVTSTANAFLGFAVEALIAHASPIKDRGRFSGWLQAGNLGGSGIGGGLGLWLLTVLHSGWQTGLVLGGLLLACAAVLPFVPEVAADAVGASPVAVVRETAVELWHLIRSRDGALCCILCFVPVGTGAASAVLGQAEIAAHWGAGADTVALVQGFLGGILSMVGCIAGGYGCVRLGGRLGYITYGAIMAAVTALMAVLPATPLVYIVGNLAYSFATGLAYAAFSAFVLEVIVSKLAATKYNAFASLSNTPIWYMGLVLAAFVTAHSPKVMLLAESAFGIAGIAVFLAAARAWRPPARTA